jgi:hypothetical protein
MRKRPLLASFFLLSLCFPPCFVGGLSKAIICLHKKSIFLCPPRYGFVILCTPNFLFLSFGSFSSTSEGKTFESHFYGEFTSIHIGCHVLGFLSKFLSTHCFVSVTLNRKLSSNLYLKYCPV